VVYEEPYANPQDVAILLAWGETEATGGQSPVRLVIESIDGARVARGMDSALRDRFDPWVTLLPGSHRVEVNIREQSESVPTTVKGKAATSARTYSLATPHVMEISVVAGRVYAPHARVKGTFSAGGFGQALRTRDGRYFTPEALEAIRLDDITGSPGGTSRLAKLRENWHR
jgi:hypothetical protein